MPLPPTISSRTALPTPSKNQLWEQDRDLRAWLFTVLRYYHVSLALRDARQRASIQLQQCNAGLTLSPTQAARLELCDLERALAKLPEQQRSVNLLVGLEGMRYEEAASVVDLPAERERLGVAIPRAR